MNRRFAVVAVVTFILTFTVGMGMEAPTYTGPVVNCGNESANDGGDTPERDITPTEWVTYCEEK